MNWEIGKIHEGEKLPLLAIVGPTATGKTDIGVALAQELNGEVISADSMLIYRYMNIGTAKPTLDEMQGVPHHMIDIVNPDEDYSVALYQEEAEHLIRDICKRGKLPILVGGTGLYIRSVIDHYNFSRAEIDWDYRTKMKELALQYGNEHVHNLLREVDHVTAAKLHINDIKRVIRALEVYENTGRPLSSYHDRGNFNNPKYNLQIFGLCMDRERLYRRVENRVDVMIAKGLIDEVKALLDRGYNKELTSMKGLGYKEIVSSWEGAYSLEEAVEILKLNTRRFAKRQLTWFRPDNRIQWIHLDNHGSITLSSAIENPENFSKEKYINKKIKKKTHEKACILENISKESFIKKVVQIIVQRLAG